jgi:DNA (cytosine-5)-methyltransferase 1
MTMRYGTVCSGIGAPELAASGLGWSCSFMSEIEPFPRAVLQERFPDHPLHGDFTTIQRGMYADVDVLIGGTPCQSFSVAGKRAGLDDPRGNLAVEFVSLAKRLNTRWIVW